MKSFKTAESMTVKAHRVFRWWDYPVFIFLSVLSLIAIVLFLFHWFSVADWGSNPTSSVLLTGLVLVVLTNNQGRWYLLPLMLKPAPMAPQSGWKVAVVTTFVTQGESIEMLQETVKAIIALDYPHDSWVLDEDDDERVKVLCESLGAKYFSRKNFPLYQAASGAFRSGSKYGNYNAWLQEIGYEQYDILTTFDPDHVPQKSFLVSVLGYFQVPTVGYVQAAQAYYNQKASFIARGAAEETYAYYSSIQMAAYGMGFPIIVGCHTSHRMTALKQVGGFPAHDAEDLLLTHHYRAKHWQGVYVPEILARGLAPVSWSGYLRQQGRWARVVLDIKFRYGCLKGENISLKSQLMSLLHGINYLHRAALVFLALLLSVTMLIRGNAPALVSYNTLQELGVLCVLLQICEFYRQRFYLNPREEWGFHWRVALLQYAKWPWFLKSFLDVLFNSEKSFELTEKVPPTGVARPLLWPNLSIIVLLATALFFHSQLESNYASLVQLFAAILLVASGILVWTAFLVFPPPYDRATLGNAWLNEHETGNHKNSEWLSLNNTQTLTKDTSPVPVRNDIVSSCHGSHGTLENTCPRPVDDAPATSDESIGNKDCGYRYRTGLNR